MVLGSNIFNGDEIDIKRIGMLIMMLVIEYIYLDEPYIT